MNPSESAANWLPLGHLNLRYNPFGERTWQDRAKLAIVDVERWLPSFEHPGQAIQFIGDCGRGKSTHLLAIRAAHADSTYTYLPEDGPHPVVSLGTPTIIDEAQRLGCRPRRKVLLSQQPLVLGTHVDLTNVLKRYGYQVQTVEVHSLIEIDHLAKVFNRRIEAAALRPDQSVPEIKRSEIAILSKRFGTDIRAMEGYLYERFQAHAGGPNGQVQFID